MAKEERSLKSSNVAKTVTDFLSKMHIQLNIWRRVLIIRYWLCKLLCAL